MTLELRNPHSILAALRHRPHDVREIRVTSGAPGGAWNDVLELAQTAGVPVAMQPHRGGSPKKRGRGKTERGSGCYGIVRKRPESSFDEIFPKDGEAPGKGLWLALDCLQDPQNVGAIFRSAGFFGVRGIILTKDKSAPINSTVYDVAAGGADAVPFCTVTNLAQALRKSKDRGMWILGTSEHADLDIHEVDRDRPWLLAIGNEQKGLRRLTIDHCDEMCRIEPRGEVTSLNASVAAGVCMSILNVQKTA
jgi:23S rRNA (guanosine2251-2'-O)-methyltransferase